MCMPAAALPFIELGVSAASSLAAFGAQQQESSANAENADAGARDQYNQLTMKAIQDEAATGQKVRNYDLEGAIKSAAAKAGAASSGVGGNSVDTIVRGIQGNAANNAYDAKVNGQYEAQELTEQGKAVYADEQSRINSVPPPNPVNTALGIAGAALKVTPDQWGAVGFGLGGGAA